MGGYAVWVAVKSWPTVCVCSHRTSSNSLAWTFFTASCMMMLSRSLTSFLNHSTMRLGGEPAVVMAASLPAAAAAMVVTQWCLLQIRTAAPAVALGACTEVAHRHTHKDRQSWYCAQTVPHCCCYATATNCPPPWPTGLQPQNACYLQTPACD